MPRRLRFLALMLGGMTLSFAIAVGVLVGPAFLFPPSKAHFCTLGMPMRSYGDSYVNVFHDPALGPVHQNDKCEYVDKSGHVIDMQSAGYAG